MGISVQHLMDWVEKWKFEKGLLCLHIHLRGTIVQQCTIRGNRRPEWASLAGRGSGYDRMSVNLDHVWQAPSSASAVLCLARHSAGFAADIPVYRPRKPSLPSPLPLSLTLRQLPIRLCIVAAAQNKNTLDSQPAPPKYLNASLALCVVHKVEIPQIVFIAQIFVADYDRA